MVVSKTSAHIKINIIISNPSQETPGFYKVPNQDLKDMDVLCTFKIMIKGHNLDHGFIRDQWRYLYQYQNAKPQSGYPKNHLKPQIRTKTIFWQFNLIIFFSNFFHKNKANCLTNNWLALASPHFKPFPPTRDKKWPQPSPLFKSIQIFREWSYRTTKNPKYWILNKTTYIANSKKMTYYIQIPS